MIQIWMKFRYIGNILHFLRNQMTALKSYIFLVYLMYLFSSADLVVKTGFKNQHIRGMQAVDNLICE